MRLDKYLSKAKIITRKQARVHIKNGDILVNNQVIKKKDFTINEDVDRIVFKGKELKYNEFHYYMLNKPKGVISAVTDKYDRTVIDLIDTQAELHPIGRLDKDTEGLLFLTNNGTLSHRLTSPKYNIEKKYYVKLENKLDDTVKRAFLRGLEIVDGNSNIFLTKPAKLEIISDYEAFVYLTEGKFHQIKRMFKKVNNEVKYLKRVTFANIELDSSLLPGQYRTLTKNEIASLKKQCNL